MCGEADSSEISQQNIQWKFCNQNTRNPTITLLFCNLQLVVQFIKIRILIRIQKSFHCGISPFA